MSDTEDTVERDSVATTPTYQEPIQPATVDRSDRRFRIEGDVAEALKVVLADRSSEDR